MSKQRGHQSRQIRTAVVRYTPVLEKSGLAGLLVAVGRDCKLDVQTQSFPSTPGLHGLLVVGRTTAIIGFDASAPAWKQRHTILHELGHLILKHPLVTDLAAMLAAQAQGRCPYPAALNQAADQFAHDLMHQVGDETALGDLDRVAGMSS